MTVEFPNCCENCEYFLRLGDSKICNAQSQPTENASEPNECADWQKIDKTAQWNRNQELQSRVTQDRQLIRPTRFDLATSHLQWMATIPLEVHRAMRDTIVQNITRLPLPLVDWYRDGRVLTPEFWQRCNRYIPIPGREYWEEPTRMVGQPDRNEPVQWSISSATFDRLEQDRRRQETEDITRAAENISAMSQSMSDDQLDASNRVGMSLPLRETYRRYEEGRRRSHEEYERRRREEDRGRERTDPNAITRAVLDEAIALLPSPERWVGDGNRPWTGVWVDGRQIVFSIWGSGGRYSWVFDGRVIADQELQGCRTIGASLATKLYLPFRLRARDLSRRATISDPSPEARRAQESFGWFCEYVTRNWPVKAKPATHHLEWHEHLVTEQNSKCLLRIAGSNVDLLAPRGSAKSTVLALYVAWVIGIHTEAKMPLQILYISYALSAARAKSASIKQIITSFEYREIFPSVLKGKKWSDEYWSIDRAFAGIHTAGQEEFTMICAGMGGTITSKRAHLVILDDVIKGPDQIESAEIREKMARNWGSVIRPTMFEGARAICLGTRFRADDVHETTFIPAKGWVQIEQQAIHINPRTGEEQSYWPAMWSLKYLTEQRNADYVSFMFQYMNKIQRVDSISINPNWIKYGNVPTNFDCFTIGVDLAASLKEKSDFSVFVLIGKKDNRYYVLDARRDKWIGNLEKIDALLSLYEDWQEPGTPFNLYVESTAYQASFRGDFISYAVNQKRIYDINCIPVNVKGDKLMRLRSVTGIFQNGLVSFNQFRDLSYVIFEATNFGSCAHDDAVDALVLALQGASARTKLDVL